MGEKKYLFGFLLLLLIAGLQAQTPYYHYAGGKKQYLELDTKHIFVSVAEKDTTNVFITRQALRADVPKTMLSKNQDRQQRFWTTLSLEDNLSEIAYLAKLSEIKNSGENIIVSPYFKNKYEDKIGLSNFFYVKLKSLSDMDLLYQKADKEDVVVVLQNEFMPLWFVVSVTENSKCNAMEMANRFYEMDLFEYAEPDLMFKAEPACADEKAWGLKNTGQHGGIPGIDMKICQAWELSTGKNTIVGLLDNGIDTTHPGLISNLHPLSYHVETGTSPQQFYLHTQFEHGIQMAGCICGVKKDTISGETSMIGTSPDCKLMMISTYFESDLLSLMKRANGINWGWKQGADVINCSWRVDYSVDDTVFTLIKEAIDSAVTFGRAGKGTVITACTHNQSSNDVRFPASLSTVLGVGSVTPTGERAASSNYGLGLNVIAPGILLPTTRFTEFGGYTDSCSGTSPATAYVSGIVSLMLSVNSNLTEKQVREIIETTAVKVRPDLYTYSTNSVSKPFYFQPHSPWNQEVGYGMVNAHKAVLRAYFYHKAIAGADEVPVCMERNVSISNPLPDSTTFFWRSSDNIERVRTSSKNTTLYCRGISVGAGWVECWAVRHGDTVLVNRKEMPVKQIAILFNNFSSNGSMLMPKTTTIGGTLTINAGHTVTFKDVDALCTPDTRIVIMPGGKMIVNNSTIRCSEYCSGELWQGISVVSNSNSKGEFDVCLCSCYLFVLGADLQSVLHIKNTIKKTIVRFLQKQKMHEQDTKDRFNNRRHGLQIHASRYEKNNNICYSHLFF